MSRHVQATQRNEPRVSSGSARPAGTRQIMPRVQATRADPTRVVATRVGPVTAQDRLYGQINPLASAMSESQIDALQADRDINFDITGQAIGLVQAGGQQAQGILGGTLGTINPIFEQARGQVPGLDPFSDEIREAQLTGIRNQLQRDIQANIRANRAEAANRGTLNSSIDQDANQRAQLAGIQASTAADVQLRGLQNEVNIQSNLQRSGLLNQLGIAQTGIQSGLGIQGSGLAQLGGSQTGAFAQGSRIDPTNIPNILGGGVSTSEGIRALDFSQELGIANIRQAANTQFANTALGLMPFVPAPFNIGLGIAGIGASFFNPPFANLGRR